jgi:myosin protein heavy chain
MILSSPLAGPQTSPHSRNQSLSNINSILSPSGESTRHRSGSKNATPSSNTFAPQFIKTEEARHPPLPVKGIEGENDFSGKRYVWLKDPQLAFIKGWIVEELPDGQILVQCDDGSVGKYKY